MYGELQTMSLYIQAHRSTQRELRLKLGTLASLPVCEQIASVVSFWLAESLSEMR